MSKRRVALIAVVVMAAAAALPASATASAGNGSTHDMTSVGWVIFAAALGIPLLLFIVFLIRSAVRKGGNPHSDGGQISVDQYAPISQDAAKGLPSVINEAVVAAGAQAGTAPTVDAADELTKLADLRDRGALTDAEFQAQKAKLLARD